MLPATYAREWERHRLYDLKVTGKSVMVEDATSVINSRVVERDHDDHRKIDGIGARS